MSDELGDVVEKHIRSAITEFAQEKAKELLNEYYRTMEKELARIAASAAIEVADIVKRIDRDESSITFNVHFKKRNT